MFTAEIENIISYLEENDDVFGTNVAFYDPEIETIVTWLDDGQGVNVRVRLVSDDDGNKYTFTEKAIAGLQGYLVESAGRLVAMFPGDHIDTDAIMRKLIAELSTYKFVTITSAGNDAGAIYFDETETELKNDDLQIIRIDFDLKKLQPPFHCETTTCKNESC